MKSISIFKSSFLSFICPVIVVPWCGSNTTDCYFRDPGLIPTSACWNITMMRLPDDGLYLETQLSPAYRSTIPQKQVSSSVRLWPQYCAAVVWVNVIFSILLCNHYSCFSNHLVKNGNLHNESLQSYKLERHDK